MRRPLDVVHVVVVRVFHGHYLSPSSINLGVQANGIIAPPRGDDAVLPPRAAQHRAIVPAREPRAEREPRKRCDEAARAR